MKQLLASTALVLFAGAASAAPHSYQVTGTVLEVTEKAIVISKGKENWELVRDAATKIPEGIKAGSKVTIEYSMSAIDVTDKTPKSTDKAGKKDKK
jgi:hypothetical protein